MTGKSGLLELIRRLNGALAPGGVYDHRGFPFVSSGAAVSVESARLETTAVGTIALVQAGRARTEDETALKAREGSLEAIWKAIEGDGREAWEVGNGEVNLLVRRFSPGSSRW